MRNKIVVLLFILSGTVNCFTQINPANDYSGIFKTVQEKRIFRDQKTFPDCRPLYPPDTIKDRFNKQQRSGSFDLKAFIGQNFDTVLIDTVSIFKHIDYLWDYLTRSPDKRDTLSSLIPLPFPYIVPGGRFREIYYWDSYFTMLGLQVSGRMKIVENMIDNFSFLIDTYGYIPNGNRTYYLSRSQPPFFSLMVELLAGDKGDSVYIKYLPQLEKEYNFWMRGKGKVNKIHNAEENVVWLGKDLFLNRYWDDLLQPRPESYMQDSVVYRLSGRNRTIYRDIRAAAESGWDFSSRWFSDSSSLFTIRTSDIIPVDLNSLLYHLELTLQKAYLLTGDGTKAAIMTRAADKRRNLIIKYCWNSDKGYFYDFNFVEGRQTLRGSLAGIYPLFFRMVDDSLAHRLINVLRQEYLKDGGLVTTPFKSGQQWDNPNGWAPLQWIGYIACKNYGFDSLAHNIALRWTDLNMKIFFNTGKMLEKYNVVDITVPGGGGEYELQDGFGWTNGVFLKLWNEERRNIYIVLH